MLQCSHMGVTDPIPRVFEIHPAQALVHFQSELTSLPTKGSWAIEEEKTMQVSGVRGTVDSKEQ